MPLRLLCRLVQSDRQKVERKRAKMGACVQVRLPAELQEVVEQRVQIAIWAPSQQQSCGDSVGSRKGWNSMVNASGQHVASAAAHLQSYSISIHFLGVGPGSRLQMGA